MPPLLFGASIFHNELLAPYIINIHVHVQLDLRLLQPGEHLTIQSADMVSSFSILLFIYASIRHLGKQSGHHAESHKLHKLSPTERWGELCWDRVTLMQI